VDGGSSDGTASEAERASLRCSKRVVKAPPGRAAAQNEGATLASGDILFFLHADTLVPLGWDKLVRDALRDTDVLMGAFSFHVDRTSFSSSNYWGGTPTGMAVVEWFANFRSKHFWLPYGDQTLFMLKQRWRHVGPFPNVPMMEDFELVRTVRTQAVAEGLKVSVLPEVARCSGRRWEKNGVPTNTFLNQWFVFAYTTLGFSAERIYSLYYGDSLPAAVESAASNMSEPGSRGFGPVVDSPLPSTPKSVGPIRLPHSLAIHGGVVHSPSHSRAVGEQSSTTPKSE
jgi:hypothetical protein